MDKKCTMPDILADDSVKSTQEYALEVFKYINNYSKSEYFTKRNSRFALNRKYLDGNQDIKDYREFFDISDLGNDVGRYEVDGNNLGRHYLRLMDKFLNEDLSIVVESSDIYSRKKKSKRLAEYEFNLKMKDVIEDFKKEGVDIGFKVDKNFENSEELDLWAASENKIMEEIILETEIKDNFIDEQFYTEIRRRILEHLFVYGISHVETYYDANNMIKHRLVQPDRYIHPICERNDMSDVLWGAEAMQVTISDARILFGSDIKEEELYQLAGTAGGNTFNNTYNSFNEKWGYATTRPYDDFKIKLVKGYIKLLKDDSAVKAVGVNGNVFIKKLNKKDTIKNAEIVEVVNDRKYEVWSGYFIEGLDKVLKWGKCKNMIKKNSNIADVQLPYSSYMYENVLGSNVSVIETMKPYIRLIDIIWALYHNVIAGISPDKYQVNIDALNNVIVNGFEDETGIDEETGEVKGRRTSHLKLIELFIKKGLLFTRTQSTSSGEELANLNSRSNQPVVPLGSGVSDSPQRLMSMIDVIKQQMKEAIGFNDWTDSSSVSDRANQLTIQNQVNVTNNATKFLEDSIHNIVKQVAEKTAIMIWDNITYNGFYAKKIGEVNASILKEQNEKPYEFDFNVLVEKGLTVYEMQMREQNITTALSARLITPVQAEHIRNYKNYKLAMKKLEIELAASDKAKKEQEVRVVTAQAEAQSKKDEALIAQKNADNNFQLKKQQDGFVQDLLLEAFKSGKSINDLDEAYKLLIAPYIGEIQQQELTKQAMMQAQSIQMQQKAA